MPMVDLQPPEGITKMNDVYEFTERMDTDLNSVSSSPPRAMPVACRLRACAGHRVHGVACALTCLCPSLLPDHPQPASPQ